MACDEHGRLKQSDITVGLSDSMPFKNILTLTVSYNGTR